MLNLQQLWTALLPGVQTSVCEVIPPVHSFQTVGTRLPILQQRLETGRCLPLSESGKIASLVQVGAASIARERKTSEDTGLAFLSQIDLPGDLAPVSFAMVADGLARRWGGEYASSIAAEIVADRVIKAIEQDELSYKPGDGEVDPIQELLIDAVTAAHETIQEHVPGSGASATCILAAGGCARIAHVGNSRAYLMTNGQMEQLTRDHSLADFLHEQGRLTPQQARAFSHHGFLYRYIGMEGGLEVDTFACHLDPASLILLCSDGVWEALDDPHIARIITVIGDPQEICDRLVRQSVREGGSDNATAIILQYSE